MYRNTVKITPIYKTNDYTLLQKEKNFIDKFKPMLNQTGIVHRHRNENKHIYIYIYIQKKSQDAHSHVEKKYL